MTKPTYSRESILAAKRQIRSGAPVEPWVEELLVGLGIAPKSPGDDWFRGKADQVRNQLQGHLMRMGRKAGR